MQKYLNLPQIAQHTPEWYKKRSEVLTSTQIASILHLNSHRSYDQLLKTIPDPTPYEPARVTRRNAHDIDPITWGSVLEPVAIAHLEQKTQRPIGELGLKIHDNLPYLGASPDGIQMINGHPRLIEIKCPKKRQITYRVPLEYWVQVQIAMEVWDVDETLYCEYKFDITTELPSTTDLTVTYGTLSRGVYWIYLDSWTYVIHRNREWFNRIRQQIENFYHLKFQPAFATNPSATSGKRKREEDKVEELNKIRRTTESSVIRASRWAIRERIPISRFSNYLLDDPILDWLEYHQESHDFQKEKSIFLDFYNQKMLRFKLAEINRFINLANSRSVSYKVLNPSIHNLLDIYENNLLLKIPYDLNLLEQTANAMEEGVGIIFMGQLAREIDEHFLWDTFDLIIKATSFQRLLPQIYREIIMKSDNNIIKSMDYIPVKLKYTTLDFCKSSAYLTSKHKLDKAKLGAISCCLVMDRHHQFGIIPQEEDINKFKEGLNWLKQIPTTSLDDLYPNMKNHYDSQWHSAKVDIANEREELTQICYLNVESRNSLHERGIKRISQLTPDLVDGLKNKRRILPHIIEKLYLPPLTLPTYSPSVEIYLDFEHCTSLGTDESIIFMTGVLVKHKDRDPQYHPFLVKHLTKQSEQEMLGKALSFISEQYNKKSTPVPVYHWSHAEPVQLSKAGHKLPDGTYWVDLYKHFNKNGATIPGCYTYGLKDVATSLHRLGKIQSCWLHGLDGTSAMVMAWNIHHKCEITGEDFDRDPRIRKLCDYNYVDCQVLLEIRNLL